MNSLKILRATACVPALLAALAFRPAAAQSSRAAGTLTARINRLLDEPPFDRALWGIAIADPSGRIAFERNGSRLFVPASAAKLVVSAVAAALLPENYRFRTSVYAAAPIVAGVIQGDLVLYGRGDPMLSARYYPSRTWPFEVMADTLRARGITRITGDVIGDASWFDSLTVHPSWEAVDLAWWYAAPASALGYNDNALDVVVAPGPIGAAPVVVFEPDLGLATFTNVARTTVPGGRRSFDFLRRPGTNAFVVFGNLPADARPWTDNLAVLDGAAWSALAFKRVLEARGITVDGGSRAVYDSAAYVAARNTPPLAEHRSRTLPDALRPILALSHNWYAEMLLRTLGREFAGVGSFEAGVAVERSFLADSLRIDTSLVELVDGSGLSHHNLIAPRAFVTLLRRMREHPRHEVFLDALAAPGGAGTLRTRFRYTPPAGRVRAKTGSISNTNTLMGYLELGDGRYWTYAIALNNHVVPNREALRRIDAIVAELAR